MNNGTLPDGLDPAGRNVHPKSAAPGLRQWIPAAAALVVLAVVVGSGFVFASGSEPAETSAMTTVEVPTSSTPPINSVTTAPEVGDETVKVPLAQTLQRGDSGDDVRRVQQRLAELPFDPGPIDGVFGQMTEQAVWAYEKLVLGVAREDMTGSVTPAKWNRMQDPVIVEPRRRTGAGTTHTEVYLVEQVVAVFEDDEATLITHASSGDGEEWCDTVTYDTDLPQV